MKKTILYVGGFELPDRNGAAHRVVANGRILRELGYDVVFLGVDRRTDGSTEVRRFAGDCFGFEAWTTAYPRSKRQWARTLLGTADIARLSSEHYHDDVAAIICYNYPAAAQLRVRRLCRRLGARYIADVTEWYESSGGGIVFGAVKWMDTTARMRVLHRLADALITTSSVMTRYYSRISSAPIVELPTLYDCAQLPEVPRETAPSAVCRWLYAGSPFNVGRVSHHRRDIKDRLDAAILLAARLNEQDVAVELTICGLGEADYLSVFPEHAALLQQHAARIRFLGKRPHAEIIARLQTSDYAIFFRESTRTTEAGFPAKLTESISYGTPVITNRLRNLENHVGTPGIFIVDFHDMEACIAATRKFVTMSLDEYAAVTAAVRSARSFDYRTYIEPVAEFLARAGLPVRSALARR